MTRESLNPAHTGTGTVSIGVTDIESLGIEIAASADLTGFSIDEDGTVTNSGFTTPTGNIRGTSGDLTAIKNSNGGWMVLDTSTTSNVIINTTPAVPIRVTPKRFRSSSVQPVSVNYSVPSSLTQVLNLSVLDDDRLTLSLNASAALKAFSINARFHVDGEFYTLYSESADYTSPAGLLVAASGDLTVLNGAGSFTLDLYGIETVRLMAASATTTALTLTGAAR